MPLDVRATNPGFVETTMGGFYYQAIQHPPKVQTPNDYAIYYSGRELRQMASATGFVNPHLSRSDFLAGLAYSRLGVWCQTVNQTQRGTVATLLTQIFLQERGPWASVFASAMTSVRSLCSYWSILQANKLPASM